MRKNKGITLVALIITIVVMLILVAVSVNVIIKSNLLGIAEKATKKYNTVAEEESKTDSIEIDGKIYNSIDEYMSVSKGITFSIDGMTYHVNGSEFTRQQLNGKLGIRLGQFLETDTYKKNPLPTTKKCSTCGETMNLSTEQAVLVYIGTHSSSVLSNENEYILEDGDELLFNNNFCDD